MEYTHDKRIRQEILQSIMGGVLILFFVAGIFVVGVTLKTPSKYYDSGTNLTYQG